MGEHDTTLDHSLYMSHTFHCMYVCMHACMDGWGWMHACMHVWSRVPCSRERELGGPYHWGGPGIRSPDSYILYIYIYKSLPDSDPNHPSSNVGPGHLICNPRNIKKASTPPELPRFLIRLISSHRPSLWLWWQWSPFPGRAQPSSNA